MRWQLYTQLVLKLFNKSTNYNISYNANCTYLFLKIVCNFKSILNLKLTKQGDENMTDMLSSYLNSLTETSDVEYYGFYSLFNNTNVYFVVILDCDAAPM